MKNKFMVLLFMGMIFNSKGMAGVHKEIIENIAKNVILKTYQDMESQTAQLKEEIENFAQKPSEATLAKAREAWRAARVPWESSEAFLFGPVDSLGLDPKVDTWPLSRLDLENVLSDNKKITVGLVGNLGNNLKGYHTIEYLLFGSGLTSNSKELKEFKDAEYDYLIATSTLLASNAASMAYAWSTKYDPEEPSPGYVDIISNPSLTNPAYAAENFVLEEYILGMAGILEEVGSGKMSDPLEGNLDRVESPYSLNSLTDFTNNVQSVYNVYTGTYGTHKGGPGIKDFVKSKNMTLALRTEIEILKSKQMIQKVSGPDRKMPFRQAIFDSEGRDRINQAIGQLSVARTLMSDVIKPLLD